MEDVYHLVELAENNQMHLLVIDDEPLILETIELTFGGDRVTACHTAQDGIDAFLNTKRMSSCATFAFPTCPVWKLSKNCTGSTRACR